MVRKYTNVNYGLRYILIGLVLFFCIFEIYLRCFNVISILTISNNQNR